MANVLFLCTGNLCRSPSAELLLEQQLSQSGTTGVTVHSAGTSGSTFGPPERLVKEGREFGLQLGDHVPRKFDTGMLQGADLVLGMAREHVREAVLADPPSFAKTFTLREIVRRGQEKGQRRTGEALGEWLARLHEGRRHTDLVGDSPLDDIADPMGGSSDDYRRMLEDVSALTQSLHQLAWP
jgi:protein-tyrosine phosphatase